MEKWNMALPNSNSKNRRGRGTPVRNGSGSRNGMEATKMNACLQCGTAMSVRKEIYTDGLFGIPVTLVGVDVYRCPNCHEYEVTIPNLSGLHAAIARHLVRKRGRFSGSEIRFLRKYLDFSSAKFAETIGVAPDTVSRWEKDKD